MVNDLPAPEPLKKLAASWHAFACKRSVFFRVTSRGDGRHAFAVIKTERAECGPAQGMRLFQNRVENWGEVAGRGVDDLQYLGGRGLLLQGLARLVDQPRILHRNDCLCGEVVQQCDVLVGEWSYLLAVYRDRAEERAVFAQSHS